MAAGLGFKDFTTGEVLTAADVDGYLMQGIWVFANATARDAAVTSPQEGNFAYLKDTNVTTYYTGSAWANLDTTGMTNPMTTTGDTIYSSSGSTPARLGIGSNGQVLTVSGGLPVWATAAGGSSFSGCRIYNSSSQTLPNATVTTLTFNSEIFDTDGFHSTSTNTSRITIPTGKAGYYQLSASIYFGIGNATGIRALSITKNGTRVIGLDNSGAVDQTLNLSGIENLAVNDYIEFTIYHTMGYDQSAYGDQDFTFLQAQYLGA